MKTGCANRDKTRNLYAYTVGRKDEKFVVGQYEDIIHRAPLRNIDMMDEMDLCVVSHLFLTFAPFLNKTILV